MKDRYGKTIEEGDVITITNPEKTPFKDLGKVFKVEKISKTMREIPCIYVDGVEGILIGNDVELYAKPV